MIDALLLDLDLTLLDNRNFQQSIEGTAARLSKEAPHLDADELVRANGEVFSVLGPRTLDDWTLGRISGEELGREAWRRTLAACGETSESIVDLASETHFALAEASYRDSLYEDAAGLLEYARSQEIPMGIVTNGASDTQRIKLTALGIIDWFQALSISGEVGAAKPDAAVFLPVLEQLGVSGKQVWHVGDNLASDVGGAQAAGLTGVWINRTGFSFESEIVPDLEVKSMLDLIELMESA